MLQWKRENKPEDEGHVKLRKSGKWRRRRRRRRRGGVEGRRGRSQEHSRG